MLATRAVASSCFLTKSRIGPRPPRVAHPATAARSRYTPSHQAHAVQSRNKQQLNTQRETATVIPGEDWRAKIRHAITDNALVFIACFSGASLARSRSYQNDEIALAIEQIRLRRPDEPWIIPVRFDDSDIPEFDIGGGQVLASLQAVDLFGSRYDQGTAKLTTVVQRILGRRWIPLSQRQNDY